MLCAECLKQIQHMIFTAHQQVPPTGAHPVEDVIPGGVVESLDVLESHVLGGVVHIVGIFGGPSSSVQAQVRVKHL